jgi:hypothetical protein
MRDTGRSLREISDKTGLPVREVRAVLAPLKAARRANLAHTPVNEERRGLLDSCACTHSRKEHADFAGTCGQCGPEHILYVGSYTLDDEHIEMAPALTPPSRPTPEAEYFYVRGEQVGCDTFIVPSESSTTRLAHMRADLLLSPTPKPDGSRQQHEANLRRWYSGWR